MCSSSSPWWNGRILTRPPVHQYHRIYLSPHLLESGTAVHVEYVRQMIDGHRLRICTCCRGTGAVYLQSTVPKCPECDSGYDRSSVVYRNTVSRAVCTVPRGCPPGSCVRILGMGMQVVGAPDGDLVVDISKTKPRTDVKKTHCHIGINRR